MTGIDRWLFAIDEWGHQYLAWCWDHWPMRWYCDRWDRRLLRANTEED